MYEYARSHACFRHIMPCSSTGNAALQPILLQCTPPEAPAWRDACGMPSTIKYVPIRQVPVAPIPPAQQPQVADSEDLLYELPDSPTKQIAQDHMWKKGTSPMFERTLRVLLVLSKSPVKFDEVD